MQMPMLLFLMVRLSRSALGELGDSAEVEDLEGEVESDLDMVSCSPLSFLPFIYFHLLSSSAALQLKLFLSFLCTQAPLRLPRQVKTILTQVWFEVSCLMKFFSNYLVKIREDKFIEKAFFWRTFDVSGSGRFPRIMRAKQQ